MLIRFPKPRNEYIPEENNFFKGVINALIICIPFWLFVVYIVSRW